MNIKSLIKSDKDEKTNDLSSGLKRGGTTYNFDLKDIVTSRNQSEDDFNQPLKEERKEIKQSKKFKEEMDIRSNLLKNVGSAEFNVMQDKYHDGIKVEKQKRETLK